LLLIAEGNHRDVAIPAELNVYMNSPEERLDQYDNDIKVHQEYNKHASERNIISLRMIGYR
jgi:hypothetical protein